MKYFTIQELCNSKTAQLKHIDNSPSPLIQAKLVNLINNLLDPIRELWGAPITVNSGYRCPLLNKAIGGVPTSQHQSGEAADLDVGRHNMKLFNMIRTSLLPYDQLIAEGYNQKNKTCKWVHVSYGPKNRKQILYK